MLPRLCPAFGICMLLGPQHTTSAWLCHGHPGDAKPTDLKAGLGDAWCSAGLTYPQELAAGKRRLGCVLRVGSPLWQCTPPVHACKWTAAAAACPPPQHGGLCLCYYSTRAAPQLCISVYRAVSQLVMNEVLANFYCCLNEQEQQTNAHGALADINMLRSCNSFCSR